MLNQYVYLLPMSEKSTEYEEYVLHLPYHLAMAGMANDLCELLTEFEFIKHKVSASRPQPLIEDYDLALQPSIESPEDVKNSLRLIQGAIRLSANTLLKEKTQLSGQLLGRLMSFEIPQIQLILVEAKKWKQVAWLRPLTPSLTPPVGPLIRSFFGHNSPITSLVVLPDGQQVISAAEDFSINIWNLQTGEEIATFNRHTSYVESLALTPDGKQLVSGSLDGTLKVWNLDTGQQTLSLTSQGQLITSVAIVPNSRWVVSGSQGTMVKVCDLETKNDVITFEKIELIKVWALETQNEVITLIGHSDSVQSLAISPDSKQIISGSQDQTIKVWNLKNFQ
ncbi:hypothetical protein [Nostoc sp. 'Peltigera membranacea cyanobiont' N6]|uniref:hypothetical protein n=1 Tax=Nostoc sp. 'Peltigera membranacea cyanobiont' N6 TaxID=1261031 RepID=UPI0015E38C83|nr:hypothetical protein [Nostoc sp. 'Peltigera membranacea cyanobiont' N6]